MFMTWHFLRSAAIARHHFYWMTVQGGHPYAWPAHMAMIRAFYGY